MEQLELELDIECTRLIDVVNDETLEEDAQNLIYKNRLRDLVKDIATFEEFEGIQITKDGLVRLQDTSKYIITMLIVEIIEELKNSNRKQITPKNVDNALDKILAKASGIDSALTLLRENIVELEKLNTNTSITKASQFINFEEK
ncbi:hypothetical protein GCM10008905_20290 [Clostridium malenominatum]|uniref:Phage protein n=1 Tax=Clostridium malenominatum TaxID=1539 RepID=A0ABN1J0M5_9CLOT